MNMENEVDEFGNKVPIDNYVEHPLHFKYDPQCSTCFSERKGKQEVEVTNQKQESNLSKLRASIEAQRALRKIEEIKSGNGFGNERTEKIVLEVKPVPEISIEGATEFSLERHTQLCSRADILYHNFLVAKKNLETASIPQRMIFEFEDAIKNLCGGIDEVVSESIKIRWS